MWTIDRDLHQLSYHFNIPGMLMTRSWAQWNESPKVMSCDRSWIRVWDFGILGVGRWRRQCLRSECPENPKEWQVARVYVRDRKWLSGQVACPSQKGRVNPCWLFHDSEVRELGALHLDSWNHEVWNLDEVRSLLWGQPFLNVLVFDISTFLRTRDWGPLFQDSQNRETR
jgi:hypothetical protein